MASTDKTEFTIDQLAHDAGLPVSTIRMYQHRGLIEPPEKRGRVGYYQAGHRERLRLIAQLQERGFSLAAIKEAVDSWSSGQSLDQLLGVGDLTPGLAPEPLRLSSAELAQRFSGVEMTQANILRAADIGLIQIEGTDVVIANPNFAVLGPAIARLGVPISVILDEYEALTVSVDQISARFRNVFEEHLWADFVEAGMGVDDIAHLTTSGAQLAELATTSVVAVLQARFGEFVGEFVAQAQQR